MEKLIITYISTIRISYRLCLTLSTAVPAILGMVWGMRNPILLYLRCKHARTYGLVLFMFYMVAEKLLGKSKSAPVSYTCRVFQPKGNDSSTRRFSAAWLLRPAAGL